MISKSETEKYTHVPRGIGLNIHIYVYMPDYMLLLYL